MKNIIDIEKIGEVTEVNMVVQASEKDKFTDTLVESGILPAVFYYGNQRVIKHKCINCELYVEASLEDNQKNIVALGRLSRQGFHENKYLLDIIGKLFDQYLYNKVDDNGFESYLYQSLPENEDGAVLSVSYYYCMHCQAQYLVSYQIQLKEYIPPFEPDEVLLDKILYVTFNHEELLRILGRPNPQLAG